MASKSKSLSAGQKSYITRQVNELTRQYAATKSAGVKSAITKKINALTAQRGR